MPVDPTPALPRELADLKAHSVEKGFDHSFCPSCGWNVPIDADGICASCGATAVGRAVEATAADIERLTLERDEARKAAVDLRYGTGAALGVASEKARQWRDGGGR